MSGATTGGAMTNAKQTSIIIDLLLFGQSANMKRGMSMTQSFSNTQTSTTGVPNQVMPLRYIVRHCPITIMFDRLSVKYQPAISCQRKH